jgi:hypothetical protein
MSYMSKAEAIAAMERGEKVTHTSFSPWEWVTMENGNIIDEKGYVLRTLEFWKYRNLLHFDHNWSLKQ